MLNLQERIALAKAQILRDVEGGQVPPTVADYSALHDYVDANFYGISDEEQKDGCEAHGVDIADDGFVAMMNRCSDTIDQWIKGGGLRATIPVVTSLTVHALCPSCDSDITELFDGDTHATYDNGFNGGMGAYVTVCNSCGRYFAITTDPVTTVQQLCLVLVGQAMDPPSLASARHTAAILRVVNDQRRTRHTCTFDSVSRALAIDRDILRATLYQMRDAGKLTFLLQPSGEVQIHDSTYLIGEAMTFLALRYQRQNPGAPPEAVHENSRVRSGREAAEILNLIF